MAPSGRSSLSPQRPRVARRVLRAEYFAKIIWPARSIYGLMSCPPCARMRRVAMVRYPATSQSFTQGPSCKVPSSPAPRPFPPVNFPFRLVLRQNSRLGSLCARAGTSWNGLLASSLLAYRSGRLPKTSTKTKAHLKNRFGSPRSAFAERSGGDVRKCTNEACLWLREMGRRRQFSATGRRNCCVASRRDARGDTSACSPPSVWRLWERWCAF